MHKKKYEFMHSHGTTAYETFIVVLPSLFLTFIATICTFKLVKNVEVFSVWGFLLEFILIVVPIILSITVYIHYIDNILISLFVVSISLSILLVKRKDIIQDRPRKKLTNTKLDFVTVSRSVINLISVVGILAVDFMIFPRRFAKTIKYGYSLMDVGVGLYVFSNGIVAPEIKGHQNSIYKTIKATIPLIVIGGIRFIVTNEIDYQVPVSEYGVHWNFFITLAVVKLLSSVILNFISVKNAIFSGISLMLAHEIMLQLGLAQFVFSNIPRDSFLTANREGIVSSIGYVGLYLLSVAYGVFIHVKGNEGANSKWKFFCKLCLISSFLLWATLLLEKNFGVSRRLANSGYVMWVLFIGISMSSLFYVSDLIQDYIRERRCVKVPLIYEAINYNGLVFFLVANLLTGFINIVFDTFSINQMWSIVIICSYMFVNCYIVSVLYAKQIKFKL